MEIIAQTIGRVHISPLVKRMLNLPFSEKKSLITKKLKPEPPCVATTEEEFILEIEPFGCKTIRELLRSYLFEFILAKAFRLKNYFILSLIRPYVLPRDYKTLYRGACYIGDIEEVKRLKKIGVDSSNCFNYAIRGHQYEIARMFLPYITQLIGRMEYNEISCLVDYASLEEIIFYTPYIRAFPIDRIYMRGDKDIINYVEERQGQDLHFSFMGACVGRHHNLILEIYKRMDKGAETFDIILNGFRMIRKEYPQEIIEILFDITNEQNHIDMFISICSFGNIKSIKHFIELMGELPMNTLELVITQINFETFIELLKLGANDYDNAYRKIKTNRGMGRHEEIFFYMVKTLHCDTFENLFREAEGNERLIKFIAQHVCT